jgi:hypothetical protein
LVVAHHPVKSSRWLLIDGGYSHEPPQPQAFCAEDLLGEGCNVLWLCTPPTWNVGQVHFDENIDLSFSAIECFNE